MLHLQLLKNSSFGQIHWIKMSDVSVTDSYFSLPFSNFQILKNNIDFPFFYNFFSERLSVAKNASERGRFLRRWTANLQDFLEPEPHYETNLNTLKCRF